MTLHCMFSKTTELNVLYIKNKSLNLCLNTMFTFKMLAIMMCYKYCGYREQCDSLVSSSSGKINQVV